MDNKKKIKNEIKDTNIKARRPTKSRNGTPSLQPENKEINISDKRMAGWLARVGEPDPIALMEVGGDSFWVHAMGHLEKPLATRVGMAGHVTSREE